MTRRTKVLSIDKKEHVHLFVSSFLFKTSRNTEITKNELLSGIILFIKTNKDILRVENDVRFIKIINELKILFDNCSMIAKMRGEDIIIPEVMKYTEIMRYLKYCFVKDTDIYIPNEEDLEYQKYFIDTISNELYSVVFSPDRISSWIHLGIDVDLTPFSDNFV
jgi:hypothetical protein